MAKYWKRAAVPLQSEAEGRPVPIAGDAVVAVRGLAGGQMIPLVILDTTSRPDIAEMVRVHEHLGPGDAVSRWMLPSRWTLDTLSLLITTTRPTRCTMLLDFDLAKYAGLVDQVVRAQSLYIQPGQPGDRFVSTMDGKRLLIEVPSRDFRAEWDRIFRKATAADFRRRGLGRAQAKQAADKFMEEWRRALSTRLRSD